MTELVLLHGFTNTGASWEGVTQALPHSYRVQAPDIRGHGSASGARPVTLDSVLAEVDALAPGRFTLGGYSQGGRIALHAALSMPGRIERLVLIGASPGLAEPTEREQRHRADEALAAWAETVTIEPVRQSLVADTGALRPAARDPRRGDGRPAAQHDRAGWPPRCAAWAPARSPRCGTAWTRSSSRSS